MNICNSHWEDKIIFILYTILYTILLCSALYQAYSRCLISFLSLCLFHKGREVNLSHFFFIYEGLKHSIPDKSLVRHILCVRSLRSFSPDNLFQQKPALDECHHGFYMYRLRPSETGESHPHPQSSHYGFSLQLKIFIHMKQYSISNSIVHQCFTALCNICACVEFVVLLL